MEDGGEHVNDGLAQPSGVSVEGQLRVVDVEHRADEGAFRRFVAEEGGQAQATPPEVKGEARATSSCPSRVVGAVGRSASGTP